jgi:Tol biopolymer transport system component
MSPDGKLVAYESDRDGGGITDIYVQQAAGGSPIRLTHCKANCMQPSFSPDGAMVAYYSAENGGGIYVVPALGGDARRVIDVSSFMGAMPKFSPDGQKLAYRAYAFRGMILQVIDLHGTNPRRIDSPKLHPASDNGFLWSPDGRGILTGVWGEHDFGLYVFPVDGGAPVQTSDSQQGRRLQATAWIGDRLLGNHWGGSRFSLAEARLSARSWKRGTELIQITRGTGSESGASPSADGTKIAFASYTEANSGVWKIPMDVAAGKPAGESVQLTPVLRYTQMPSPAARANVLAYVSVEEGASSVWFHDLSTGKERRIAEGGGWPLVSADGRKIVYGKMRQLRSISPDVLFLAAADSESARKICDHCGIPYHFFAGDTKVLWDHAAKSHEIRSLDLVSGRTARILRYDKQQIFSPHLSPDEKWISFLAAPNGANRTFYVAPFRGEQEIPESEWIQVLSGDALDRQPFWSPVGDLLYFMSDRDGFRCIWALRLDPHTRKPAGEPFAVQHFHDARYTLNPFNTPGNVGLSVSQDAMFLSLFEERANVWLAEEVTRR